MATTDQTATMVGGASHAGKRSMFVIENMFDFDASNKSAADVLKMLNIQAGWFVAKVVAEVVTEEGATLTFDVGDGDDVDGYIDGANGNSAGLNANSLVLAEAAPNTVVGYSNGKLYTAADTIDLLINNDAATAKITVRAAIVDLS